MHILGNPGMYCGRTFSKFGYDRFLKAFVKASDVLSMPAHIKESQEKTTTKF